MSLLESVENLSIPNFHLRFIAHRFYMRNIITKVHHKIHYFALITHTQRLFCRGIQFKIRVNPNVGTVYDPIEEYKKMLDEHSDDTCRTCQFLKDLDTLNETISRVSWADCPRQI